MISKTLNWTAIGIGWAMRTFGGFLASVIVNAVVWPFIITATRGSSMTQRTLILLLPNMIAGAFLSVFCGYIVGLIAEKAALKHAAIVGALCVATSLIFMFPVLSRISAAQSAVQIAFALLTIPFVMLGGVLAQSKRRTTTQQPSQPHPFDPIPRV